jgi:hypothetical protein
MSSEHERELFRLDASGICVRCGERVDGWIAFGSLIQVGQSSDRAGSSTAAGSFRLARASSAIGASH